MPPLVIAAIGYVVASKLVIAVGLMLYSAYQQNQAKKKARDAYNASLTDRLTMVVTAQGPRSRCYGRVRNCDGVLFKGSWGPNLQNYTLLVALAGHEIDGVEQVYVGDTPVAIGVDGGVLTQPYWQPSRKSRSTSVTATAGQYVSVDLHEAPISGTAGVYMEGVEESGVPSSVSGTVLSFTAPQDHTYVITYQVNSGDSFMVVKVFTGAPGQDLSTELAPRFGGLINSAHKFAGIALLMVDMYYNTDVYPNGVPAISAVFRGAKVLDPRTGITAWSENNAVCARDWARYQYGGGCDTDEIDDAAFIAAANACDTAHTYTMASGSSSTVPLYRCGYVAKLDVSPEIHLGELVEGMAGKWGWAGGRLRVRAGAYSAPVATLDDSWLSDKAGRQISPGPTTDSVVNIYKPTIADAAQAYVESPLPEVRSATYITADGEELPQDITLGAVTFAPQAQHVCGVLMRDQHEGMAISWPCNLKAWRLELFDVVAINSTRYGWSGKTFEVLSWRHSLQEGVVLGLKETGAAIYTPDATFADNDLLPNTALPSPFQVPEVAGLVAASGTGELILGADGIVITRVRVAWDAITDYGVLGSGLIEVAYTRADQPLPNGSWASITVPGSSESAYLQGLNDGATYLIKARAANSLVRGNWSQHIVHTVLGKTQPPADVTGLEADDDLISWAPVPDVDVRSGGGYELRWQQGVNNEWETAQPLHRGIVVSSPYAWTVRPIGPITVLIKARDSSGNYSINAAATYVTVSGGTVRNIVETHAWAPTFAGTIAAGTLSGGQIGADVISTFWDANTTRLFWGLPEAEFWDPLVYGGIDYTTDWWTPALAQDGDAILLTYGLTNAVGVQIEYQADTHPFWSTNTAAPFWGSPSAPFWDVVAYSSWLPWPGAVAAKPSAAYRWRLRTAQALDQTLLASLTAYLDGPDVQEVTPLTNISAGGTRLPLAKSYRSIAAVLPSLITGSTAVTVEVQDQDASLGPLIKCLDASRTAVAADIVANIKGY